MAEQELDPIIDHNNDAPPFEDALKRTLFHNITAPLEIQALGLFAGDYGRYWKIKASFLTPQTDVDGKVHDAGSTLTLLLNEPGKDASEGQWKAYQARLAELQVNGLGLPRPDSKVNMKGLEGKRITASLSVYTNPTSGNPKQQVNRFGPPASV